jgi:serine/threonine protein kinase/CheY-like chemotaxis protein
MSGEDEIRNRAPEYNNKNIILTQIRHELRTPLNAIIGYGEILLEDAADLEWQGAIADLEKILDAARRLLASINDLLAPARLEAQEGEINVEGLSIKIRAELRSPLDEVLTSTDRLIIEAEREARQSQVSDLRNIRAAGRKLRAFIEDITSFTRVENKKQATTLMASAVSTTLSDALTEGNSTGENILPAWETEFGSLLVVDDNEMNRDVLSRYLVRHGHRVATAGSGREALRILGERYFDLVLLDIMMPEMDGYEVLDHLKSNKSLRNIPVIFISAVDDTSSKIKAFKSGGVDYVTKPFQADEVVARVENQLKIAGLQKALERQNRELVRRNEELTAAQRRTDVVFSALSEILPGTVLDEKYRLEHKIGSGGFGAVYRATHLGLNKPVAVKIFRPTTGGNSPEDLERFRLEGKIASRIQHPNALAVLDCGISAGMAYLVMELLEGHTLIDELNEEGTLSPSRAVEILIPVCEALTAAHKIGIVHRDIKPSNIFLHRAKEGEIVKVVDFGIAKLLASPDISADRTMTMQGGVIGTPAYIAPERFADQPYDGRADVYSLGVVLYQMLSGQLPFQTTGESIYAMAVLHLTKEPIPLRELDPNIPEALESLVAQTLLKEPHNRPTAKELAERARALGRIEVAWEKRDKQRVAAPKTEVLGAPIDEAVTIKADKNEDEAS